MELAPTPAQSVHRQHVTMVGTAVGAAAADLTIPTTNPEDQAISTGVRTGAGAYTVVVKSNRLVPRILAAVPTVYGTDGKRAQVISVTEATRTILVQCYNAAGAAADLAATDTLKLVIDARLSIA